MKDIKGYEGIYEVSESGEVWTIERTFKRSNGRNYTSQRKKVLPAVSTHGYLKVVLSNRGVQETIPIHTIVAMTYNNHVRDGYESRVIHKDKDKLNNHYKNLETIHNYA